MLRYGTFEAWLQHDAIPITEIATQQKDNVVQCIIPCNGKLPFQVHWRDNGSGIHTAGFIVVDGVKSSGRFLLGKGQTNRHGYRTGETTEEPYTFTTDHGTIELRIALKEGHKAIPNLDPQSKVSMREQQFANQGLSYRRIPGLESFTVPPQRPATLSVSSREGQPAQPYITFVWHYRTVSWLKQHGMPELRPNTPPIPLTVHHSRDAPSQYSVDWPDTAQSIRPPSPRQSLTGVEYIEYLARKHKPELNEEMERYYGYEYYDIDDPNCCREEKRKYKPRKSKKGKEREVPVEEPRTQRAQNKTSPTRATNKRTAQPATIQPATSQPSTVQPTVTQVQVSPTAVPHPLMTEDPRITNRPEFEAEMLKRYGPDWANPKVTKRLDLPEKRKKSTNRQPAQKHGFAVQSKPDRPAADTHNHPRTSNTYVLPSPALTNSSLASTPRASSSSSPLQPPPIPYLTPSGRPSVIIDFRAFGLPSPAPSNASNSSSSHRYGHH